MREQDVRLVLGAKGQELHKRYRELTMLFSQAFAIPPVIAEGFTFGPERREMTEMTENQKLAQAIRDQFGPGWGTPGGLMNWAREIRDFLDAHPAPIQPVAGEVYRWVDANLYVSAIGPDPAGGWVYKTGATTYANIPVDQLAENDWGEEKEPAMARTTAEVPAPDQCSQAIAGMAGGGSGLRCQKLMDHSGLHDFGLTDWKAGE